MKISQRAQQIPAFQAMEFGKHAAALEAAGHDVIRFNLGEPDFGAPPAVIEALRTLADGRALPYTAATGLPALQQAISDFYRHKHDVTVAPERIIVTAGASAALLLVAAALVDPGDEVLVGDPAYPCNRQFLAGFGARVKLVPTAAAQGFQLDAARVRQHWGPHTHGLLLASPSNPTGTLVPAAKLQAICDWVRQQEGWRIIDEIYLDLSDPQEDGRFPRTVLATDPDAIVINSFSKYFGMTGWRLGWCVVPDALRPAIERLAQNFYICPPTPAQHAALACFTPASLAVCEQRRQLLAERRALVLDTLEHIGLPTATRPAGAFYVYLDIRHTGLDAATFCRRALHEAHVALTPGLDFGELTAHSHVRLSFATATEALQRGLTRLGDFVAGLRQG